MIGIMSCIQHSDPVIPLQHHPLALIRFAERHCACVEPLLYDTGISMNDLERTDIKISYEQYTQLISNCRTILNMPAMGLLLGQHMKLMAHGAIGVAAQCCKNIKEALELAIAYKKAVTPITNLHLEVGETRSVLRADLSLDAGDYGVFFTETLFANLYQCFLLLSNESQLPVTFRFEYAPPMHEEAYRKVLGEGPILFRQSANEMECDTDILMRPIGCSNPQLVNAAISQVLADFNQVKHRDGLLTTVREGIKNPSGSFLTLDQLAERLLTSTSTLKRHLQKNNTSYRKILDDVRRDMAIRYLATTRLTVEAIAERLEFSEVAGFRKAFKKWTGQSPSEFRDGLNREEGVVASATGTSTIHQLYGR